MRDRRGSTQGFTLISRRERAFTLIELLVVMSIIALLLTIGLSFYGNAQRATRDTRRRGDLDAIRKAYEIYRTEHGTYDLASTFPCNLAPGWGGVSFDNPTWGAQGTQTGCWSSIKNALGPYIVNNQIPEDPLCSTTDNTCNTGASNYFLNVPDPDHFVIYAQLENAPTSPCTIAGYPQYNYCVRNQQ